ncbi:hypothetical protein GK1353 [Geobacillus kaustophilus HTA426]|uniref:Uncharacterized protein n=1 Tax=Geobacillus kaustophilus (strain HTA426) TaxID=235909 RepID=Q5L098_GEOKA|nr:hypothetical protein GK1353 [Geobacillus kaustophilus HTA426]
MLASVTPWRDGRSNNHPLLRPIHGAESGVCSVVRRSIQCSVKIASIKAEDKQRFPFGVKRRTAFEVSPC